MSILASYQKFFYLPLLWLLMLAVSLAILKASPSAHQGEHSWFQKKRQQTERNTKVKLINMTIPSGEQYKTLTATKEAGSTIPEETTRYYELLTEAFPSLAGAHYVLGFCYYRLGQTEKAFEHLRAACVLAPDFFWGYYNLGMLLLNKNQAEAAAQLLSLALTKDPKKTLQELLSSKVFRDILAAGIPYDPAVHLQTAYLKAAETLKLIAENKAAPLAENGLQLF